MIQKEDVGGPGKFIAVAGAAMLNTATLTVMTVPRVAVPASVDRSRREPTASDPIRSASAPSDSTRTPDASIARRIADTMQLIEDALAPQRRVIHAGDPIYRAGDRFGHLYLLNSGLAKVVGLSADGREQVVGLKFRGDWIGFDGIANDRYTCDAIAMDTGEVWVIRYEDLLSACRCEPSLRMATSSSFQFGALPASASCPSASSTTPVS